MIDFYFAHYVIRLCIKIVCRDSVRPVKSAHGCRAHIWGVGEELIKRTDSLMLRHFVVPEVLDGLRVKEPCLLLQGVPHATFDVVRILCLFFSIVDQLMDLLEEVLLAFHVQRLPEVVQVSLHQFHLPLNYLISIL